jgi:drug/metabolite transporter (DMT)-like permease
MSRLSPPVLALIAIFILSVMDAMIKGASADFGTLQIVLMRFAMGALVMIFVFTALFPGWPSWETVRVNGLRGFLVVFTALTFFYGLATLPLAEALALSFLSPIFIAGLGIVLLKEQGSRWIVMGLALGTAGMLVMVYGLRADADAPRPLAGILAAIASAFSYGLAIVLLRARATKDPVVTIVFIQHLVPSFIVGFMALVVTLVIVPQMADVPQLILLKTPTAMDWVWFLGIGICGSIGHFVLALAFSREQAARLAPLDYTSLIWAVLFGYLFFEELPGFSTLVGACLIAMGAYLAGRKTAPHAPALTES